MRGELGGILRKDHLPITPLQNVNKPLIIMANSPYMRLDQHSSDSTIPLARAHPRKQILFIYAVITILVILMATNWSYVHAVTNAVDAVLDEYKAGRISDSVRTRELPRLRI